MRFIDEQSLERLGTRKLLNRIEPYSPYGKVLLQNIFHNPFNNKVSLEKEFQYIEGFLKYINDKEESFKIVRNTLHNLKDLSRLINSFSKDTVLEDSDFFEIKILAMNLNKIYSNLNFSGILLELSLTSCERIIEILDPKGEKIPTFQVYSEYSTDLLEVRNIKKDLENRIYSEKDKELREKLLSERLLVVTKEAAIESEVRRELVIALLPEIENLKINLKKVARIDFLLSKSVFTKKYGGKKPVISNSNIIGKELVNLELQSLLKEKNRDFTKLDITLKSGANIITGANMGGKSIALKTITENLLLFHLGIYPLGEYVEFPILDFIYFISDDMQDLSKGLSTFGAEIKKLQEISIFLKHGVGLIVFDEFARGTNPEEGRRFVKALANYLNKESSFSLLTTHFDGVATSDMNHYQVIGLKNIDFEKLKYLMTLNRHSMEILQEYMDYRLEQSDDYLVPKYAFNIASLLGMDSKFSHFLRKEYEEANDEQ